MIRIFVGTSEHQDDKNAEKVLEYTLRKNCSQELDIVFMRNIQGSFFGGYDNTNWWTPFSYLRWTIPEYCNFDGKAIYMDVDQVNFKDISEFYNIDLKSTPIAVREKDYRTCVMLMDCKKLKGLLPSSEELKHSSPDTQNFIVKNLLSKTELTTYDKRWNCLDGENLSVNEIWHLHFTEMTTQPWNPQWAYTTWERKGKKFNPKKHPRGDLVYIWKHLLKEAIANE